jgi:hypothetical protein
MVNTAHTQLSQNSVPRRIQQQQRVTTLRSVWQDNPTTPRDRAATPQPASPLHKNRPTPFDTDTKTTHPGRPKQGKSRPTTIHLQPRVRAELERKAREEGLSVSATAAAILEWFFTQRLYEQHTATLDSAIDKAIGRHLRAYSDRNASLQARTLKKVEFLVGVTTNILGRQPGIDERQLDRILNDADDAARASITRTSPAEKKVIADEQAVFDQKGGK